MIYLRGELHSDINSASAELYIKEDICSCEIMEFII